MNHFWGPRVWSGPRLVQSQEPHPWQLVMGALKALVLKLDSCNRDFETENWTKTQGILKPHVFQQLFWCWISWEFRNLQKQEIRGKMQDVAYVGSLGWPTGHNWDGLSMVIGFVPQGFWLVPFPMAELHGWKNGGDPNYLLSGTMGGGTL